MFGLKELQDLFSDRKQDNVTTNNLCVQSICTLQRNAV